MSSSVHIDNKNKDILRPTQKLYDTTLTAKAKYPMEATFFCLLMLQKYISSKQKTLK